MGPRHYNRVKTALLFGVLWAIVLGIGWVVGQGTAQYLWVFTALGLVMTFVGFWNSDKVAIRAMRAFPVSEQEAPQMYRIVRELSQKAQQQMPRLYISPTEAPNAFATGRSPKKAVVCCTEGLLRMLNERELRGVLGHELMHVYNRDILTASVAAALAGVITSLARFLMFFSGGNRRNSGSPLAALAVVLLAPFAAMLIQLGIQRTREFDADQASAMITGDPAALASSLRKLEAGAQALPLPLTPQLENVAHMMIINPFRGGGLAKLFATHPPVEQRIARLEAMGGITRY